MLPKFPLHLHRDHSMTRPPNLSFGQCFDTKKSNTETKTFCSPEKWTLINRKGFLYENIYSQKSIIELVVEPTHLKNMLLKIASSPPENRDENSRNIWVATSYRYQMYQCEAPLNRRFPHIQKIDQQVTVVMTTQGSHDHLGMEVAAKGGWELVVVRCHEGI